MTAMVTAVETGNVLQMVQISYLHQLFLMKFLKLDHLLLLLLVLCHMKMDLINYQLKILNI